MRTRWIVLLVVSASLIAACDNDGAELSTSSTIVTGPTGTHGASTTTTASDGSEGTSTGTSLVGEPVGSFRVVARIPNDNGETLHIVIPSGAYTDVDIENFMLDLLESNTDMYGAEVFDDEDAALAFVVEEALRTDEQKALLDRHHFLSLIGRDRIEFRGPFSDFSGGAIGS